MAKNRQDGPDQPTQPGADQGFRGRKVTTCSFCGKTSREVGPMVEGPNAVYVCSSCTDLCQNIFRQEKRRVSSATTWLREIPAPREIKGLGEYYFSQQASGAVDRRVLLVRFTQTQFDDLFIPAQTSAPLATPGE